ncbi:MAG: hypothetical protein ACQZ3N_02870 [cyanobacterium endosymbiont of Rhopalodia yunnanensis]
MSKSSMLGSGSDIDVKAEQMKINGQDLTLLPVRQLKKGQFI